MTAWSKYVFFFPLSYSPYLRFFLPVSHLLLFVSVSVCDDDFVFFFRLCFVSLAEDLGTRDHSKRAWRPCPAPDMEAPLDHSRQRGFQEFGPVCGEQPSFQCLCLLICVSVFSESTATAAEATSTSLGQFQQQQQQQQPFPSQGCPARRGRGRSRRTRPGMPPGTGQGSLQRCGFRGG